MSKYGIPEQDLSKNLSNKINKIDTVSGQNQQDLTIVKRMLGDLKIDSNKTIFDSKNFKSKNVKDALDELFINVDNEKNKLYSAIIDKKVTPKSKELKDLTSAIDSIKLGQGTAQPSDVLDNKTFTNDSGVVQEGNIPNMGSKEIEPKIYTQELESGFYSGIKVNPIDRNVLQSNFPELKQKNIKEGVTIAGIYGTAVLKKYASNDTLDRSKIEYSNSSSTNKDSYKFNIGFYPTTLSIKLSSKETYISNPMFTLFLTEYIYSQNTDLVTKTSNGFIIEESSLPHLDSIEWYATN